MNKYFLFVLLPFLFKTVLFAQANPDSYNSFFEKAYQANPRVPKGILEAVAFSNTRIQHITHSSQDPESCIEIPKAYGVMGLTLDGKNYFRNNLKLISEFSKIDELSIISDPEKNIMAYAKAYTTALDLMNIKSSDPSQQVQVLVALSELPFDGELQNDYALNTQLYSIFRFLNNAEHSVTYSFPNYNLNLESIFGTDNYKILSAPAVVITKTSIKNNKGESYTKSSSSSQVFSTNYGPAIWNPTSCNYSSRSGTAVSAVTVHTVQGSYAGCISWFKNCSAQVSAHYVVRSSDGQVTQMVLESNKAWHVGNHNPYTIGIEHEGYINNTAWYTNAMYGSSANIVKDICLSGYGILPTSCYNGPSCNGGSNSCLISTNYKVKGHQHFSSQSHTDPGINWDWPKYYCLINNCGNGPVATPPPPVVSSNLCGSKTLTRATPPSGVTYFWQGTSCGTSTSNSAATYVATTSGTYYLRAQDNNSNAWSTCSSVNVTVNQVPVNAPAPTVSSSSCGLTVLSRANPPAGISYYWQGASCGTGTGNSAATFSVTASGTNYLRARSTAGCWSAGCSSIAVNVIASPATPPVPSLSSNNCGPKTLTRATPPSGTSYFWQGTACGTSTLNSAATYTVGINGTYYLRAKNTPGCWSNCSSIAVNITPCPTNLSASVGGACPNKTVSLNWVNSGGTWTVDVSLDPAFGVVNSKTVTNVSSVAAPAGFSPTLVLQPNANYYWRMKSGVNVLNGPPFTVPFCDLVTPSTSISAPSGWQNTTFTTSFTDADNNNVGKSFYNISDFNGSEWRANGQRGFFNDNFNSSLNNDWTTTSGSWAVTSGNLEQTDETSINTNLSALVTQTLSNRYLYHWNAKIDGSGNNRKAGLHFFGSSSTLANRGNSYLVQVNVDGGTLEFHKSVNDVLSLVKQTDYNFVAGQYYDFKLIYDRISGKMDLYVNDILIESWMDVNPLSTGNIVSFRTQNAAMVVNYFEVLRSRNATAAITVGSALTNDIRFQNAGPNMPAGKIMSLVTDAQGNISTLSSSPVNVDWTPPASVAALNDGTGSDISTTLLMNQLSANWGPSVDPNSGTTNYYYSIGTTPTDSNITPWTNNNLQLLAMKNNLALTLNQVYYFNVKAKNGAGLYSPVLSTNGQTVVASVIGMEELSSVSSLIVYPNPFNETAVLDYTLDKMQDITLTLTDVLGRSIAEWKKSEIAGNHKIQIRADEFGLATGMYFLKFQTGNSAVVIKLIFNK